MKKFKIVLVVLLVINLFISAMNTIHLCLINQNIGNDYYIKTGDLKNMEIKMDRFQDSVVYLAGLLLNNSEANYESVNISSYEYTYFINERDYYIQANIVHDNANFFELQYEITPNKIDTSIMQDNTFISNNYGKKLTFNKLYMMISDIQKYLYPQLFADCEVSYSIVYGGIINSSNEIYQGGRNYPIYLVDANSCVEITSIDSLSTSDLYVFNLYIDSDVYVVLTKDINM